MSLFAEQWRGGIEVTGPDGQHRIARSVAVTVGCGCGWSGSFPDDYDTEGALSTAFLAHRCTRGDSVSACEHESAEGVDQAPSGPDKVWRCCSCGFLYRVSDGRIDPACPDCHDAPHVGGEGHCECECHDLESARREIQRLRTVVQVLEEELHHVTANVVPDLRAELEMANTYIAELRAEATVWGDSHRFSAMFEQLRAGVNPPTVDSGQTVMWEGEIP